MQSAGSYRALSFSKYLPHFGFNVAVITVKINQFTWNGVLDNSVIFKEKIIRTKGIHTGEILKFISNGRLSGYGQTRASFKSKSSFTIRKILAFLYDNIITFPDPTLLWYILSKQKAYEYVKNFKPDILLSSALPISTHLLAGAIQNQLKIPWVADYRDLWSIGHINNREQFFRTLELSLEKRLLSNADVLTTVSEPLAEKLKTHFKKPVHVITNGFEQEDLDKKQSSYPHGWRNAKINAVYTGMIYPFKQDPIPLFDAILILIKEKKIIQGDFIFRLYGPNVKFYKNLFTSTLLNDFVYFGGNLERKKALNYQMHADLLIIFEWLDNNEKGIYTTKFFEYIGTGKPILSIGKKGSVIDKTLQSTDLGVSENDPKKVSEILLSFIRDGKLFQKNSHKNYLRDSRIQFTREYQAEKMANVLDHVLRKNR